MEECIRDQEAARLLAHLTVAEIVTHHRTEIEEGVVEDRLFDRLSRVIEDGRRYYEDRVDPGLHGRRYYDKALVDHLLKPFGRIKSRIW